MIIYGCVLLKLSNNSFIVGPIVLVEKCRNFNALQIPLMPGNRLISLIPMRFSSHIICGFSFTEIKAVYKNVLFDSVDFF